MTPEGSADLFRIHYQNAEILTHVVHRQLDPNCDLGQGLGDTWGRVKIRGGWKSLAMGLGFRLHFFVFFAFGLPKF